MQIITEGLRIRGGTWFFDKGPRTESGGQRGVGHDYSHDNRWTAGPLEPICVAADKEIDQTLTKALLSVTAPSEVNPVPLPVDAGSDSGEAPRAKECRTTSQLTPAITLSGCPRHARRVRNRAADVEASLQPEHCSQPFGETLRHPLEAEVVGMSAIYQAVSAGGT